MKNKLSHVCMLLKDTFFHTRTVEHIYFDIVNIWEFLYDSIFNCRYHGAWWYRLTSWKQSNLNGKYYNGTSDRRAYIDGVYWRTISQNHSLKKTEMKLRPQVLMKTPTWYF